jgi:ATP-dependent Clp protease adapter protein ClpS
MISYVTSIVVLFIVVAQSIAFSIPNVVAPPSRSNNQPFVMIDVTDSSLEVTDFHLDKDANTALMAIDTLRTSSTITAKKATNIYEVYKSNHLCDGEIKDHFYFEKWILILFNDSDNTRSRVCQCLVQNAGLSEEGSYMKMMHAHRNGEAIIGEYCQEHAEYYKDALVGSGLVCDIFPVEE